MEGVSSVKSELAKHCVRRRHQKPISKAGIKNVSSLLARNATAAYVGVRIKMSPEIPHLESKGPVCSALTRWSASYEHEAYRNQPDCNL